MGDKQEITTGNSVKMPHFDYAVLDAKVGNGAKMHEALVKVNGALDNIMDYDVDGVLHRCVSIIKQALASPPRNCDVGTAEEQVKRHVGWCDRLNNCSRTHSCRECFAKWAQMSYEEGGAK